MAGVEAVNAASPSTDSPEWAESADSVGGLFAEVAARYPDRVAVVAADGTLTYGDLNVAALRLAARLRGAGAGRDTPVAVLFDRARTASVVAAVAVWQAGAGYLPLDPASPAARNRRMAAAAEPAAVIGDAAALEPFADLGVPVFAFEDCDTAAPDTAALDTAATDIAAPDTAAEHPGPDALAYLVHTSGSTGEPKAVAVPHRALIAIYRAWARCYDLESQPRVCLQAAGPAFDVHVADLARALLSGGRLVLCPTQTLLDPAALAALIEAEAVDTVEFTPAVLRLFLAGLDRRLDSLRLVISGGERWSVEDFRAVRARLGAGVRIVNSYGVAEAAVDSTWYEAGAELPQGIDSVPIGVPFPGVRVSVLDEAGYEVGADGTGELWIAGPTLALGYHRDPAATAERFQTGPEPGGRRYRTGDLVRRTAAGLVHLGRVDDEVKVRGVRGRLGGVEAVLTAHPAVTAAAVLRAVRGGEPVLIAHLVADPAAAAALREHAASLLPPALVPELVFHDSLPLTPSGKVDRAVLAATTQSASAPQAGFEAADEAERTLVDLWTRHLGRPPRGRDENLFEAGGSSLTAALLAASIRETAGVVVSTAAVFAAPTVGDLARELRAARSATSPAPIAAARAAGDEAPLAPNQRRLWILHTLRPEDPTYNLPTVFRLEGPVEIEVLRRALDYLVERHDAFRTAFENTAQGPIGRVLPAKGMPWEQLDGDGADAADADAAVEEFVARPFDLRSGAVVRAAVVTRSATSVDLVIVAHHAVYDGWSERVLASELGTVYNAFRAGSEPVLPELAERRLDVGRRQAAHLAGPAGEAQRAYWRERFADVPPPLALLSGVAAGGTARAGVLRAEVSAARVRAASAAAAAARTTPGTVLLAAFAALLSRWSGQADLVVGVPSGDRDDPAAHHLVGFDVATLPVRVAVDPDVSFSVLLDRTHRALAGAIAHGEVPFDEIVDAARGTGGVGTPLFRVWFNWLGAPVEPPVLDGVRAEVVDPPIPGALFDLGLYVTWSADGARLDYVYDPECFDEPVAAAFAEQYTALLDALCGAPEQPVAEHVFGPQDAPADLSGPVPDLVAGLARAAREHAGREAVRGPGGVLTYRELYQQAAEVAAGLAPDTVVGVYAERTPDLVRALLGVLGAGAAFTILDAAHPPVRLAAQLAAAGAGAGISVAGEVPAELAELTAWQGLASAELDSTAWPTAEPAPAAPAYIAFTSGTTGQPRGVVGTAEPLAHFLHWYTRRHGIGPGDRIALLSGLSHDPLLREVFAPLWTGATLSIPAPDAVRAPRDLRDWLNAEAVTVIHATPALCRLLALPRSAPPLPQIRLVCCSGDTLTTADAAQIRTWAPNATIVHGYGTTETPQLVSARILDVDRLPAAPLVSAAAQSPAAPLALDPIAPGAELLVLDRRGRIAAVGELGDIVVRGPYLAARVLGDPAAFAPDPVPGHRRFATGDRGRRTPDGRIVLAGRRDDQVKAGGVRIEPAEIDLRLRALPGVADAAAAVRPGPDGEARVIAWLVPEPGRALPGLDAVRARLRVRLPEAALPAAVVALSAIPLTPNGKPDRAALPAPPPARPPRAAARPGHGLERLIADLWCAVLGVGEVPVDRNFFDLGAGSLQLARVHQALEEALGRRIPIAVLFGHATVRDLAAHLGGAAPRAAPGGRPRPVVSTADLRSRRLAARTAASAKEEST